MASSRGPACESGAHGIRTHINEGNEFLIKTGTTATADRLLGLHPVIEVQLALHNELSTRHICMALAAKLGAVDLVSPDFVWCKMNCYAHAGDGVLRHAHVNNLE